MVNFQPHDKCFQYPRFVQFSDTDAMGVVHHANYIYYMEEARVAWLRHHNLTTFHYPEADLSLAVVKLHIEHFKPARFSDQLKIFVEARTERLLIEFQYAIQGAGGEWLAAGRTSHVAVNSRLKPMRLPAPLIAAIKREVWTETWL